MTSEEINYEQEMLDRYGISRVLTGVFHFGGYRYSNLADAVAEAKRQTEQTPDDMNSQP